MIRKRLRKIQQIDTYLDKQLQDLDNSCKQSECREQQFAQPNSQSRRQHKEGESLASQKFKHEILSSLKKLHMRINKLESKTDKQNFIKTPSKNYQHQRRSSHQDGVLKVPSNVKFLKSHKPLQIQLSKRRNTAASGRTQHKPRTFSIITPKNAGRLEDESDSSIKLLEQMLEQELNSLRQNKYKEKAQKESSKSNKKLIQHKILKIGKVIQKEKSMEGLYKNLQWQTKELVDTLNETRSLCSYQKQKIDIYKSKLKQFKKVYGKQNM